MASNFNWDDLDHIGYESDGREDFYDESMISLATNDQLMRQSALSGLWGAGRFGNLLGLKHAEEQKAAHEMRRVRDAVYSFIKVHGISKQVVVQIAVLGQETMGCCSFQNNGRTVRTGRGKAIPKYDYDKPVITLDKSIYEMCSGQEMLDVYCGIGLHEASHANHTRKGIEWQIDGTFQGFEITLAGLFEDERIEELARKESPGFAPYIQAAKRTLFEKKEFGDALANWGEAPDLDKMMMVLFGFIRTPHLLKDEHKEFRLLDDSNPWKDLRKMIPNIPRSEDEVKAFTKKVMRWLRRKRKIYKKQFDTFKDNMTQHDESWADWTPEPGDDFSNMDLHPADEKAIEQEANRRIDEADKETAEFRKSLIELLSTKRGIPLKPA